MLGRPGTMPEEKYESGDESGDGRGMKRKAPAVEGVEMQREKRSAMKVSTTEATPSPRKAKEPFPFQSKTGVSFLDFFMDSARDVFIVYAITRDRGPIYQYVNVVAARIIGLPKDKIVGANNTDIFGEEEGKIMNDKVFQCYEEKADVTFDHEVPLKGGSRYYSTIYTYHSPAEVMSIGNHQGGGEGKTSNEKKKKKKKNNTEEQPKEEDEILGYVFGVCRDVTVAKEAEVNLLHKARAKSMFLANVSHDLRTPLTGIINVGELLQSSGNLNEEQLYLLDILTKSGDTLLHLCNDLTDISRVEHDQLMLQPMKTDLPDCIKKQVDLWMPEAHQSGIFLSCEKFSSVHRYVVIDPNRLSQIVSNLVSNALKYTHRGGSVTVSVLSEERAALRSEENEILITLTVKDTGVGIHKDDYEAIFNPYRQSSRGLDKNQKTKQAAEGCGLGLSIVNGLCRLMGGSLKVESEPSKGSTFVTTLVAQKPNSEDISPQGSHRTRNSDSEECTERDSVGQRMVESSPALNNNLHVMIVEDDAITGAVMKRHVSSLGVPIESIKVAVDGGKCLDMLQNHTEHFDLILMDWNMPILDGLEATQKIRSMLASKNQPMIYILTAAAMKGDREKCLKSGADGYITKPVSTSLLKQVLAIASQRCVSLEDIG